jgi:energy-converting hydrogenase Eha subunit G
MFIGFGVVFFVIEHTMHEPVVGDWEGFPGEIAESIKGTKLCVYLWLAAMFVFVHASSLKWLCLPILLSCLFRAVVPWCS